MTPRGRALLFWTACVPTRAWLASGCPLPGGSRVPLPFVRVFAAFVGGRWLAGLEVGDEGVFGGPTWWAEERVWHGALWASFALSGRRVFLWIDLAFGVANWFFSVC